MEKIQGEHINVLELRAVDTAICWVLSSPFSYRSCVMLFCDSLVTICSLNKGRSSSRLLLPRLRSLSALLLASGIKIYFKWVPTHLNPADEPSRVLLKIHFY